jgi:hypothetical protein
MRSTKASSPLPSSEEAIFRCSVKCVPYFAIDTLLAQAIRCRQKQMFCHPRRAASIRRRWRRWRRHVHACAHPMLASNCRHRCATLDQHPLEALSCRATMPRLRASSGQPSVATWCHDHAPPPHDGSLSSSHKSVWRDRRAHDAQRSMRATMRANHRRRSTPTTLAFAFVIRAPNRGSMRRTIANAPLTTQTIERAARTTAERPQRSVRLSPRHRNSVRVRLEASVRECERKHRSHWRVAANRAPTPARECRCDAARRRAH